MGKQRQDQNQEPEFQDRQMQCAEGTKCSCGGTFIWTAGEQLFYYRKGHAEPKRCKEGREAYKMRREAKGSQGGGNRNNKPQRN